jgi:hypothetical protein
MTSQPWPSARSKKKKALFTPYFYNNRVGRKAARPLKKAFRRDEAAIQGPQQTKKKATSWLPFFDGAVAIRSACAAS